MRQAPKPFLGLLTLMLALFVSVALARTTIPQNDQSDQSGQSQSDQGQAAQGGQEQQGQQQAMKMTGCLEKSASGSGYQLTDNQTQKVYQLTAADGVDLSPHVGHTVEITGEPEAPAAGQPAGAGEEQIKVTSVKHVSDSCTPPSQ